MNLKKTTKIPKTYKKCVEKLEDFMLHISLILFINAELEKELIKKNFQNERKKINLINLILLK